MILTQFHIAFYIIDFKFLNPTFADVVPQNKLFRETQDFVISRTPSSYFFFKTPFFLFMNSNIFVELVTLSTDCTLLMITVGSVTEFLPGFSFGIV